LNPRADWYWQANACAFRFRSYIPYGARPEGRMGSFQGLTVFIAGWTVCAVVCVTWGIGLAYGLHRFILATNPGSIAKLFGYGAIAYISIPNFGLINEGSIPEKELARHLFIKSGPWILFIAASLLLAFRPEWAARPFLGS
jgi:hypothetical protein